MDRDLALAMIALLCVVGLAASPAPAPEEAAAAPPTPRRPATDTYFGTSVEDDYRWLENGADPEVRAWSEAQNARARTVLDALPHVGRIRERAREIAGFPSPSYAFVEKRGPTLFAIKTHPPRQQPFLVAMTSPDAASSERVLVDPNSIDAKGSTSIDFYVPSSDGRLVAVSLSQGGSEAGSVHVYETATGRELPDVVARVNGGTAGGDVAWTPDGSAFFYTRYPRPGERPAADLDFHQQVFLHRLGAPPESDAYVLGKELPRIAEITFETSADGRLVLAVVKNGDGGDASLYLGSPAGAWKKVASDADFAPTGRFGPDGTLYLLSRKGAPRGRILRMSPGSSELAAATVVVPEGDGAIEDFRVTEGRIFVAELLAGFSRLRVFDRKGRTIATAPIPPASSVSQLAAVGNDAILFSLESALEPRAWLRAGADGRVSPTPLRTSSPVDFRDSEAVREWAVSRDGTRVPVDILRKKETPLDGNNPTLLTGYGGYGVSQKPAYSAMARIWVEQGGVLAVAGLRGGGEFGDGWHRAGHRTRKQNVFDDFAACAERLIALGYTKPSRLAIEGGSNGGLLMGAMLTQHPERFGAVVGHVGIYDMLRVELSPNGEFNITEFGTVKDAGQFRALYAYSPYHRVKDGTPYPSVLFLTGANDPRVDPMQSRKMTARLQAANSSGKPVLLRTSNASGHGIGSSLDEKIGEAVDVYAFLFDRLGVAYRPVK
jgi:prolyl oligopeptidase